MQRAAQPRLDTLPSMSAIGQRGWAIRLENHVGGLLTLREERLYSLARAAARRSARLRPLFGGTSAPLQLRATGLRW
eukprot:183512-Pleurochrysis_carterae.AAC.7